MVGQPGGQGQCQCGGAKSIGLVRPYPDRSTSLVDNRAMKCGGCRIRCVETHGCVQQAPVVNVPIQSIVAIQSDSTIFANQQVIADGATRNVQRSSVDRDQAESVQRGRTQVEIAPGQLDVVVEGRIFVDRQRPTSEAERGGGVDAPDGAGAAVVDDFTAAGYGDIQNHIVGRSGESVGGPVQGIRPGNSVAAAVPLDNGRGQSLFQ